MVYFQTYVNWLKSYCCTKKTWHIHCSEIIAPYPCCRPYPRCLKKIVFDQLYDYLITNGLLFESQCGLRKQKSTELAALELTDPILSNTKSMFFYQRTGNKGATGNSFWRFVVSYICELYTYCEYQTEFHFIRWRYYTYQSVMFIYLWCPKWC